MDSCSLFNFFFGTKKATRELSKCFSGLRQQATSERDAGIAPPNSPLRQLHMRIVGLTTSKRAANKPESNVQDIEADCKCNGIDNQQQNNPHRIRIGCGTYRATLVQSKDEPDEEDDCQLNDRDELMEIDIVENLSMKLDENHQDELQREAEETAISIPKEDSLYTFHNNIATTEGTRFKPKRVVLYSDFTDPLDTITQQDPTLPDMQTKVACDSSKSIADKRNVYVRNLIRSFESNDTSKSSCKSITDKDATNATKAKENGSESQKYFDSATVLSPYKPKPPKTPPKTNKAKCLNWQLSLNKPTNISELFRDEHFLLRLFDNLEPLDRCAAAQVCKQWRNILYADTRYWKDLIIVIDCTQLRREHLIECILTTLQSARSKQQGTNEQRMLKNGTRLTKNYQDSPQHATSNALKQTDYDTPQDSQKRQQAYLSSGAIQELDQEDVWRIQELCNRFSQRTQVRQQQQQSDETNASMQQHHEPTATTSKSSSIPSQISSTISSVSISSLLSPLSESSRVESLKEKLYSSLDERAFEGICMFGATDDDIEDFLAKCSPNAKHRLIIARLNNCSLSNNGLESFISTFKKLEELELSGCNELTNAIDLSTLSNLKRLIITDCFNMADGLAQRLVPIISKLDELTVQAYHLTDAFLEFIANNGDTSAIRRLELPNCKEITNQSIVIMAKYFPKLEALSISGSTKICDDGLEFLTEHVQNLQVLNLSWCTKITDNSLERIASDLGDTLTDLILDRNINITNIGLGFLTKMSKLALLHIRWCSRLSDMGLEAVVNIKSLRYLSLAGLHQITAGGLFYLIDTKLQEVELTNCPAVNSDLIMFLSSKMPNCNIIY